MPELRVSEKTVAQLERVELALGGYLLYAPAFLPCDEADVALARLLEETPWEQGEIRLFGKRLREPRLTAWYGSDRYTYSGRTVTPVPWSPLLLELKERMERAAGARFNSALLNLYRNGEDSMGLHSDDEAELGHNPVIGSLSLGQARRFTLQPRPKARALAGDAASSLRLNLGHGDLLVMAGTCQHQYRHGVPKQPALGAARLNLTFRLVHGSV